MTEETLAEAKRQAERFLEAVAVVEDSARKKESLIFYSGGPTGTLWRALMDLTRALEDLQK